MKVKQITTEEKLIELASAVDIKSDVLAAFAQMDKPEAFDAIEARLRETRAYLQHMEELCYSARRIMKVGAYSARLAQGVRS